MRVLLSTIGSRGDVQPLVALAVRLRELGHAIFVDSRHLFCDDRKPTAQDFFNSDLGLSDKIRHPELRRLTEMALTADFPIVLGGASLVNGTLFALVEAAWRTGSDVDRGYSVAW